MISTMKYSVHEIVTLFEIISAMPPSVPYSECMYGCDGRRRRYDVGYYFLVGNIDIHIVSCHTIIVYWYNDTSLPFDIFS